MLGNMKTINNFYIMDTWLGFELVSDVGGFYVHTIRLIALLVDLNDNEVDGTIS